uniref:Ubiquinone/menaquinone biosynthesis C-methylase UbiE n=1 Tax=Candidatus Kentrum sp. LFY TaxID=2126342 RepID=A0A450UUB9_9GAMM|nr:MAG: Ubiquinone/menaquinone biosynthesis C-methylase UbiE [Candidatus Kentron sp. LFY]
MAEYDDVVDIYTTLITSAFQRINHIFDNELEISMAEIDGKDVLDVPCGNGKYSQLMLDKGANRVLGIDVSETMINLCKEKFSTSRAHFFCGDVSSFDFSKIIDPNGTIQKYDIIYTFALWHYFPTLDIIKTTIKNLSSFLKKNGSLYALVLDSRYIPCVSGMLNVWNNSSRTPLKDGDKISWNYFSKEKWMFPQNIKSYFWKNKTLKQTFEQNGLTESNAYNLREKYQGSLTDDEKTTLRVWSMWEFVKR